MNRKFYLLDITVSGINCITDEMRLDFYKRTVNKSFDPANYRIKGIYGENGCGKTAVVAAVQIMKDIICRREALEDQVYQEYLQSVVNCRLQNLHLECEFYYYTDPANQIYHYTVELLLDEAGKYVIAAEELTYRKADYPASKVITVFSKDGNIDNTDEEANSHKQILKEFGETLCTNIFIGSSGDIAAAPASKESLAKLTRFVQVFKPELKDIRISGEDDYTGDRSLILDYGEYQVGADQEGSGIRRLIGLYPLLEAAEAGRIVFIDEMDKDVNEVISGRIIEFLTQYGMGQLCFTVHNTYAMSVLRKYKNSIDFMSSDSRITSWRTSGNYSPERLYREGMIEKLPFNIEPEDFLGII